MPSVFLCFCFVLSMDFCTLLFNAILNSENILQRYHLPRKQTNKCPITDDKAPLWRSQFPSSSRLIVPAIRYLVQYPFPDQKFSNSNIPKFSEKF
ncbi:hypothetical protein T4D_6492, partial [Trichinella pseudospiralis]